MRINQSAVVMESERQASRGYMQEVTVGPRERVPNAWAKRQDELAGSKESAGQGNLTGRKDKARGEKAATLELSGKGKKPNSLAELEASIERQKNMLIAAKKKWGSDPIRRSDEDFKIKMLQRLLESLRAFQEHRAPNYKKLEKMEKQSLGFSFSNSWQSSMSLNWTSQSTVGSSAGSRVSIGDTHWEERVTMSTIFAEREATVFSSRGVVETADGRRIEFNLNFEMSREFMQSTSIEYTRKIFCVDPLVINLEGNPASFSDQTFFFDLDGDGKEEELSGLQKGSGFLALDKNHDGIINDGNELFGTKSGDGFKDLAAYDEDGNGWIDEDDSIFDDLKIWTMDEKGNSRLISLREAGIGAIYLGNIGTEFSLKEQGTNKTQGIIRSTGVFLKENGEAGTIQHVDYAL